MKTVVLDTNVLLADPKVILSFPKCNVVIPEIVLSELDKIKVSRTDADVRFRGREVSRIIFDLSEEGSLVDGVDLPDGGTLRIFSLPNNVTLPEGMSLRNTDDKILACAWVIQHSLEKGAEMALITNDLNMLLKAQTLGIPFEQWGDGTDGGWTKKYIIRPFQRYKVPITILAVAVAVFLGVFIYLASTGALSGSDNDLPPEYKNVLSQSQVDTIDALSALQKNPNDPEMLLKVANYYYGQYGTYADSDPASALNYGQQGIRYYERFLKLQPDDNDARTDMAVLDFYTGDTDTAIQELGKVLKNNPNHVQANYNLGIIYWQGRQDYTKARAQFEKVMSLTKGSSNQTNQAIYQQSQNMLKSLDSHQDGTSSKEGTSTS